MQSLSIHGRVAPPRGEVRGREPPPTLGLHQDIDAERNQPVASMLGVLVGAKEVRGRGEQREREFFFRSAVALLLNRCGVMHMVGIFHFD